MGYLLYSMHISEIVDMGENTNSTPLKAGDFIKITKMSVKETEKGKVAEIDTSNSGKRYSFGKAVIGKAESKIWNQRVSEAVHKDASDGLDVWVTEEIAKGSGRPMLQLSWFEPRPQH